MIHLVMAIVDYEGRDPVRAFTDLAAAEAFLAKVQEHHGKLLAAYGEVGGWDRWFQEHPARDFTSAHRWAIESIPLNDE